jgi:hypothetical protein
VGKPEGKRPLGRPRLRCMNDIKMVLREIGWYGLIWLRIGTSGGLDLFPSSVEGTKTPSQLGPLELTSITGHSAANFVKVSCPMQWTVVYFSNIVSPVGNHVLGGPACCCPGIPVALLQSFNPQSGFRSSRSFHFPASY